jgi:protoporphyrinogen oxidase
VKNKFKYIILGGGPSGLSVAHGLIDSGCDPSDLLILEKESEVGGLCRSREVDGSPLDTGGGHFLDIKKQNVLDFIFRFLPEKDWNRFDRVSKIRLRGQEVDHPLEANLWQLDIDSQLDYLESIALAGSVKKEPMPESFSEYIRWKLGNRIADEYMIPYNEKIWSIGLNELGTYWLYKLPNVSFRETLQSCIESHAKGSLPAHGIFLYPKEYGYGEVWRRMGGALKASLVTSCLIESINLETMTINGMWKADKIISTIPWAAWSYFCALDDDIKDAIKELKYASIDVEYHANDINSDAHWIYEPDKKIPYHRILARSNFCTNSQGYWTETNSARTESKTRGAGFFHNEFAYPVNTLKKPALIEKIDMWAKSHNVIPLGRWGRWEHMNSDIAVSEALALAERLMFESLK